MDDALVANALRYMHDHCNEPIGVVDIAEAVHTTRRTVERRFRDAMGTTISFELARLRLEKAKLLLVDSNLWIKQIASAAGFGDTKRLNDSFRRIEGCLPSQYRQRCARQGD